MSHFSRVALLLARMIKLTLLAVLLSAPVYSWATAPPLGLTPLAGRTIRVGGIYEPRNCRNGRLDGRFDQQKDSCSRLYVGTRFDPVRDHARATHEAAGESASSRARSTPRSSDMSSLVPTWLASAVNAVETTANDVSSELQHPDPERREPMIKKVLNALLLVVSFGSAAYVLLNIDHGMTRGWSQSEIAMRIPLDNWSNYETSLAEKPIETKTLINVVIYLLGDWLSQTLFQQKNVLDFDPWRTLRNGFIGLCFGPLVAEYYNFSDFILPPDGGMLTSLQKILMDQTLYLTVKCSLYISAVGLLQGDDVDTVKDNVKDRLPDIVKTAWKFWPLVHCVTYGAIPAQHRILWVNSVDLVWNGILATLARGDEAELVEHEVEHEVETAISEALTVDEDSSSKLLEVMEDPLIVLGRNSTFEFHSAEDRIESGDSIASSKSSDSSLHPAP